MSNSIAPGSSANVNVRVTALTTNPNVPVTYKTIILKKNLVNGVNTLTQEMMSAANTKYVIKYDYVLGENITVPTECILEFDGGSINGAYILTGLNTCIDADIISIFGTDVTLAGTWNVAEAYPEWFGAKGDGVNNDTPSFLSVINMQVPIFLSEKTYKLGSMLQIYTNFTLISEKGIITYSSIRAYDNNPTILIKGVKFTNISGNAIELKDCNTTIENCIFENIGISDADPTTYGHACYNNGGKLIFRHNHVIKTHSTGVGIINDTKLYIEENIFDGCYFRAISSWQATNSIGCINDNYIKDNGKYRTDGSGVGSNGIYGKMPGVIVKNNVIENVAENGIEGYFKAVVGNVIDGTGVYENAPTPSTSGVYFEGAPEGFVFANNIIKNTKLESVSVGSSNGEIKGIRICDNVLLNAANGNNIRIINLDNNSRKIDNCIISGNKGDRGLILLIGNQTKNTNIIKNNDCVPDAATINYCKNLTNFAIKTTEVTTFDDETLGTFSIKNGTPVYEADGNGKKLSVSWGVYTSIYKTIKRVPSLYSYGIKVTFKGKMYFLISDATTPYITNSITFESYDEYSEANFAYNSGKDTIINIVGTNGETLEIKDIEEFIIDLKRS